MKSGRWAERWERRQIRHRQEMQTWAARQPVPSWITAAMTIIYTAGFVAVAWWQAGPILGLATAIVLVAPLLPRWLPLPLRTALRMPEWKPAVQPPRWGATVAYSLSSLGLGSALVSFSAGPLGVMMGVAFLGVGGLWILIGIAVTVLRRNRAGRATDP